MTSCKCNVIKNIIRNKLRVRTVFNCHIYRHPASSSAHDIGPHNIQYICLAAQRLVCAIGTYIRGNNRILICPHGTACIQIRLIGPAHVLVIFSSGPGLNSITYHFFLRTQRHSPIIGKNDCTLEGVLRYVVFYYMLNTWRQVF